MFSFFPMLTFTKPKYLKLVKPTKKWQPARQLEKKGEDISILWKALNHPACSHLLSSRFDGFPFF